MAAVSMPLLGSRDLGPFASSEGGTGGFDGGAIDVPLVATNDSALVAPRNPLGVLIPPNQGQILVYIVQPGDTPLAIAEKFGVSLNTILWANNLSSSHRIRVGDELIILPVSGVQYVVKKGDTIASIAKKFKGDPEEILSFNGLAIDETLEPGATLIIPDGEVAPAFAPAPSAPSRFSRLPQIDGYYLRPIVGGRKTQGIHGYNGVDLANSCGSPVLASASGSVIIARNAGWNGGYGKYVVIAHPNGTQTLYAHLASLSVVVGEWVVQGGQIGQVGSSGRSTGCHVHFEIRGARNPF